MPGLRKKNKTAKRQRQHQHRPNITKKVGNEHEPVRREHHQYYTTLNYDGNTLSVESKQDNQPIRRKKYTLKQLRREIPVAAELINKYLDGKVPRSLHNHQHPPHAVSIYPVLPNPVDLGLIPRATESRRHRCRRSDKHDAAAAAAAADDQMMKLYVSEKDGEDGEDGEDDGRGRGRKIQFM